MTTVLPKIDLTPYTGEWVVICDEKVIGHNKRLSKLSDDIQKCKKSPTVAKIPKEDTLIF